MERHEYENLLEQLDVLIEAMDEHDQLLYIALEVAHQLRDEIIQVEPEEPAEDE
jgi:hypothetical protein